MRFPIFGEGAAPSTTVVNYGSPVATGAWNATESNMQIPLSDAAVLSEFRMILETAPGAGASYVFTVRKNGVDTGATITISGEAKEATWQGEVSFAAGDLISISSTPSTGTVPASAGKSWPLIFLITSGKTFFVMGGTSGALGNTETGYAMLQGQSVATPEATESDIRAVMPMNATLTKIAAWVNGNPGSGAHSYSFTVRKNGSTDLLTAKIESVAVAATGSGSEAVAAGDLLALKYVPSGAPTTGRRGGWCMSFTPEVEGESAFLGGGKEPESTTAANFFNPVSIQGATWGATESTRLYKKWPALVLRKFYVAIGTAPGVGKKRTYTLRSNSGATAAVVEIAEAATTGNYTGADIVLASVLPFDIGSTPSSTPAANTGGVHFGFVISTNQTTPIPLAVSAGQSAATLGPTAPTQATLNASSGQSGDTLGMSARTALALASAAGQSGASMGFAVPRPVALASAAGQSGAAIGINFPALLPTMTSAGVGGFNVPLLLGPEVLLSPELLLGGAATVLILTVEVHPQLDPASGQSAATLGLTAIPEFGLSAAGQSGASMGTPTVAKPLALTAEGQSAAILGPLTARTFLPLDPSSGQSAASLGVKVATAIALDPALGRSNATLGLTGTGSLILAPSAGQSNATLGVTAKTELPALESAGLSEAELLASVPVFLALDESDGVSTATLGLTANSLLDLATAAGVSTATLAGAVFRGMELIDQGRDGVVDGGVIATVHRGRQGDAPWAI